MHKFLLAVTLTAGAFGAMAPCPTSAKCPIHGSAGIFTRTSFQDGKNLKWFKCSTGDHEFYIVC